MSMGEILSACFNSLQDPLSKGGAAVYIYMYIYICRICIYMYIYMCVFMKRCLDIYVDV